MSITRDDIAKVAHLARLKLSDEDLERFGRDLEKISEYVGQLTTETSADAESNSVPIPDPSHSQLREDHAQSWFTQNEATAAAPQARNGFFRVPKVIDRPTDERELGIAR